jgi:2-polyprenyl-6-hydroxyphenyl methylase/3-demethylubiquinone-9 3-methyltransferase
MTAAENVNAREIEKFGARAAYWWDPAGEFRTLHAVNPLRVAFIREYAEPLGRRVLDIGCGGGILSESLAREGAEVTGIDLADELLDIAELHGLESGLAVNYRKISAERLAELEPAAFDIVTCMEMLEHVPSPGAVVEASARLVKPGGKVFFSTLNRNLKSYLLAIVGAEYLFGMIPKGTHAYAGFIRPSELNRWARAAGLDQIAIRGIAYQPLRRTFRLSRDIDVNYLAAFQRREE